MTAIRTEEMAPVTVLQPVADAYNGDPATDIVNLQYFRRALFMLMEAAGGTGTVKIQVQACTNNAGGSPEAIAFNYRLGTDGDYGALTASAATGYTTTAGANKLVLVEVDGDSLPAGKPYVRLLLTEVVDSPCLAGVACLLLDPRYEKSVLNNPLS